jgi:hypothetical protein
VAFEWDFFWLRMDSMISANFSLVAPEPGARVWKGKKLQKSTAKTPRATRKMP